MKVLLSAYACSPVGGSELGVGWDCAVSLAEHHEIIVLTRTVFRSLIEDELERAPQKNLSFVYYDLPPHFRPFGIGDPDKPTQFYYVLWQRGIRGVARELLAKHDIWIIHHVTFVKYWAPSFFSRRFPCHLSGDRSAAASARRWRFGRASGFAARSMSSCAIPAGGCRSITPAFAALPAMRR